MKTSFRAFGIGLFIAGMCLALLSQFDMLPIHNESATYKKEIKALEKQLAALQTEQTTEKTTDQSVASDSAKTSEEKTSTAGEEAITVTPAKTPTSTRTTDIKTATIFIYEGMSLYEIGQQVEGEGIVLNGREVELYLSRPEYSRSIQKGAFDLRSDMTIEEIAKTLTGKKLD
ncbi:MAG: hypothetical protein ABS948_09965 [Solibacillus sp.]